MGWRFSFAQLDHGMRDNWSQIQVENNYAKFDVDGVRQAQTSPPNVIHMEDETNEGAQMELDDDELLNDDEVASVLGLAYSTPAGWRRRKMGPTPTRSGGNGYFVHYRRSELERWMINRLDLKTRRQMWENYVAVYERTVLRSAAKHF